MGDLYVPAVNLLGCWSVLIGGKADGSSSSYRGRCSYSSHQWEGIPWWTACHLAMPRRIITEEIVMYYFPLSMMMTCRYECCMFVYYVVNVIKYDITSYVDSTHPQKISETYLHIISNHLTSNCISWISEDQTHFRWVHVEVHQSSHATGANVRIYSTHLAAPDRDPVANPPLRREA